jgi:hypothetical protein
MFFVLFAKVHYMGLGDLHGEFLCLKFVLTKGPKNEDTFSDYIQGNRQSTYTAPEDSQGIALVAA